MKKDKLALEKLLDSAVLRANRNALLLEIALETLTQIACEPRRTKAQRNAYAALKFIGSLRKQEKPAYLKTKGPL